MPGESEQTTMRQDVETLAGAAAKETREPVLRVQDLVKHFRRNDGAVVTAIDNASFEVCRGEALVLLGPSGCGKTTLLRCIAGLENPDSGLIEVNGRAVFSSKQGINLRAELRQLAMVFQSYALWPHMTVMDNIAYPLMSLPRTTRPSRAEVAERVLKIMAKVGISGLERQYPNAISGGQQQRVALCRALIAGTNLVLFDEPLSNVDAQVRERLRDELMDMQRAFDFASIFVTHDRQEAMVLADRIAVLNGGIIRQLDAPAETYRHPADRFVAHFIGPTNELKASTCEVQEGGKAVATTELGPVHGTKRGNQASSMIAAWRPEAGLLTLDEPVTVNRWRCTVDRVLFYGSQAELTIKVANLSFRVLSDGACALSVGSAAWFSVDPQDVQFLADQ